MARRKEEPVFDEKDVRDVIVSLTSYKKYRDIVSAIRKDIDPEKTLEEANQRYAIRRMRSLDPKSISPDSLS